MTLVSLALDPLCHMPTVYRQILPNSHSPCFYFYGIAIYAIYLKASVINIIEILLLQHNANYRCDCHQQVPVSGLLA